MADGAYAGLHGYHGQMHRAYRLARSAVAKRMSVIHPDFGRQVLAEFRALVVYLQLKQPRQS